jgi:hypothetical protein
VRLEHRVETKTRGEVRKVYLYDPESYRQLYDERMAELRRDYPRAQTRRLSSTVERCVQHVRSLRPRMRWRSAASMDKLFTIAALVAALAVPASAGGQGVRVRHPDDQIACPHILPGRPYGFCGGRIWVRDPQGGQYKAISFWKLQHLNDPNEDRP